MPLARSVHGRGRLSNEHAPTEVRALAYTAMVGRPEVGDRVILNASALLKGLGTGGLAFVVAVPDRLPADAPDSPGHIVKARYTPQHMANVDA